MHNPKVSSALHVAVAGVVELLSAIDGSSEMLIEGDGDGGEFGACGRSPESGTKGVWE
jgi:hypothetical protein